MTVEHYAELPVSLPKKETGDGYNGYRRAFRRRYTGRDRRSGWRGFWEEEGDVPKSVIHARFGPADKIKIEDVLQSYI